MLILTSVCSLHGPTCTLSLFWTIWTTWPSPTSSPTIRTCRELLTTLRASNRSGTGSQNDPKLKFKRRHLTERYVLHKTSTTPTNTTSTTFNRDYHHNPTSSLENAREKQVQFEALSINHFHTHSPTEDKWISITQLCYKKRLIKKGTIFY